MTDFLDILFPGHETTDLAAMHARMDAEMVAETARISALKAEAVAVEAASRCTRCGGTGRLSQFMHRNNGVCYGCGGSGKGA
jgi:Arc/MetJ family transcription regulator